MILGDGPCIFLSEIKAYLFQQLLPRLYRYINVVLFTCMIKPFITISNSHENCRSVSMVSADICWQALLEWLRRDLKPQRSQLCSLDLCKKLCPQRRECKEPSASGMSARWVSVSCWCSHARLSKLQWLVLKAELLLSPLLVLGHSVAVLATALLKNLSHCLSRAAPEDLSV